MAKLLLAGLYENKLQLRIVDERVIDTKDLIATSFVTAAFDIREYLHRRNDGIKDILLVIDEESRFFRARVDGVKSKDDLRGLWDIAADDFFGYIEYPLPDGRREYIGLRYAREVIEPYLALTKKLKLNCLGIIPLDFLYARVSNPVLIVGKSAGRTRVKLFDGQGHFFLKHVFSDQPQQLEQIILFAEREGYIAPGVIPRTPTPMEYARALEYALDISSNGILYSDSPRERQKRKKFRLNSVQQMLLTFVLVMLVLACIPFLQYLIQAGRIKHDLRTYAAQLLVLRPQFDRLQLIEQRTKAIQKRLVADPEVRSVLRVFPSQAVIRELSFDQNTALIACTAIIPRAEYERVIMKLKALPEVENVNVIYVNNGPRTEFKVIVKVRL
jgi:hypothetical protein